MYRSMMQMYVKRSDKAVERYQRAFDAALIASHPNDDGTFMHAELDVYGQVLAISEAPHEESIPGNTMQFCLHFGEGKEALVHKACDALLGGAAILYPLGPCDWSPLMVDFIDVYGVRWCLFV